MVIRRTPAESVLAALDPAPRTGGREEPPPAADRHRILGTARIAGDAVRRPPRAPHSGRPTRRRVIGWAGATAAVAGTAVAATVVGVPGRTSPPAEAATPPGLVYRRPAGSPPAAVLLHRIAQHARTLPDVPTPRTATQHFLTQSWSLNSRIDGETTTSTVLPERTESWVRPDGSARVVTTPQQRGFTPRVDTYGPGGFARYWPQPVPEDPAALARTLQIAHPVENGEAEVIVAVGDLYGEQVLGSGQHAAVLDVLAGLTGLGYQGEVTDRMGRPGQAFSLMSSYSGLPTRYTVIVDPASGALLGTEEMLTETAGRLNVKVPSVISYVCYLRAEAVAG